MSGSLKRGLNICEILQEDTPGTFRTLDSPKIVRRFSDDLSVNLDIEDVDHFEKGLEF